MEPEEFSPARLPSPADALGREDLERLSVAELEARIGLLENEIARTRRTMKTAINHRASADSLFKR